MSKCMEFFDLWKSCWSSCHFLSLGMCTQVLSHSRQDPLHYRLRQVDVLLLWEHDALPQLFLISPWQAGDLITQRVPPAWGTLHAKLPLQIQQLSVWDRPVSTGHGPTQPSAQWKIQLGALPHTWRGSNHLWNHMDEDEIWWDEMMTPSRISCRYQRNLYDVLPSVDLCSVCTSSIPRRLVLDALPPAGHRNGLLWGTQSPSIGFEWFWYGMLWLNGVAVLLPRAAEFAWSSEACFHTCGPKLPEFHRGTVQLCAAFNLTP